MWILFSRIINYEDNQFWASISGGAVLMQEWLVFRFPAAFLVPNMESRILIPAHWHVHAKSTWATRTGSYYNNCGCYEFTVYRHDVCNLLCKLSKGLNKHGFSTTGMGIKLLYVIIVHACSAWSSKPNRALLVLYELYSSRQRGSHCTHHASVLVI